MSSSTDNRIGKKLLSCKGQATVEAAFMLPVLFLLVMLLCQPAILLYNRVVMEGAASEGCRLIATRSSAGSGNYSDEKYEGYIRRRLSAIPPIDCFHIHDGGCSYSIELNGSETSGSVSVEITNKLRLLPLMGMAASALGASAADGIYTQTVMTSMDARPSWVSGSPGSWLSIWQ